MEGKDSNNWKGVCLHSYLDMSGLAELSNKVSMWRMHLEVTTDCDCRMRKIKAHSPLTAAAVGVAQAL